MKFYLDSADLAAIRSLWPTGIFHGVTTNPLILGEQSLGAASLPDFAKAVADLGAADVFFQSFGATPAALYERGKAFASLGDAVVVKIPATRIGFEAAAQLIHEDVRVCITAVYDAHQALLADVLGAAFVAPYLGRMNAAGRNGHALIAQMATALDKAKSSTKILAASIKHLSDIVLLAENGVPCVTIKPDMAESLFREPLTLDATASFEAAAQANP